VATLVLPAFVVGLALSAFVFIGQLYKELGAGANPRLFFIRLIKDYKDIKEILFDNKELTLPKSQGILK